MRRTTARFSSETTSVSLPARRWSIPSGADNRFACDTVDAKYGCVDQDAFTTTITVTPLQPLYDVAVYGFAGSRDFAYSGVVANPVNLTVTAVNLGSVSESFTVTFKADS